MSAWAAHVEGKANDNVVPLKSARAPIRRA
jgi:hypothetical protein